MIHTFFPVTARFCALAAAALLFFQCSGKKETDNVREIESKRPVPAEHRIPGEYLIKLSRPERNFIKTYFSTFKVEFIKPIGGQPNVFHIKVHPDPGPEYMKREAVKEERIEYIEPNLIFQLNK